MSKLSYTSAMAHENVHSFVSKTTGKVKVFGSLGAEAREKRGPVSIGHMTAIEFLLLLLIYG